MRLVAPVLALLFAPAALAQWIVDPAVNFPVATAPSDQNQPLTEHDLMGGHWVSWLDGIGTGWDVRIQHIGLYGCPSALGDGVLVADRNFSSTQSYGLDVATNGDALLAYRDDGGSGIEVGVARVHPWSGLLWSTTITSGAGFIGPVRVTALSDGSCMVAWSEDESVRLMRVDDAGVPLWASPTTLTPTAGFYAVADLHAAGGTDSIVSIVHLTGGFSAPRHLLAQRVDGLGATAWGLSPVSVFDSGSLQIGNFPGFVSDGQGGAVFAWYSSSPSLECYVQRLNASGAPLFTAGGLAVSTSTGAARVDPHVHFDAFSDEVIVAWEEQSASQALSGISLQRFDAGGNRLLGPTGATVAALTASDTNSPRVLRHDPFAFGTTVTWEDAASFGDDQVFSTEVDLTGSMQFGVQVVASTSSGKSRYASGGGNLVWSDERSDGGDIYLQPVPFVQGAGPAPITQTFCIANPNSAGMGAAAYAYGSTDPADNAVWMFVDGVPAHQFGIFVVSRRTGAPIPLNQGVLCLSGQIGRFMGPGQILNAGAQGRFCLRPDLRAFPQGLNLVPVLPGDTWYFQAWFRDANPGPTANFSSGMELRFQ